MFRKSLLSIGFTALMVSGLTSPVLAAENAEEKVLEIRDSGARISGLLVGGPDESVGFHADYSVGGEIEIVYRLPDLHITLNVDQDQRVATLAGRAPLSGEPIRMNKAGKQRFRELLHHLQLNASKMEQMRDPINRDAIRLLANATELMATFDRGRTLKATIVAPRTKGWVSLCGQIGQSRTAYWTNNYQTRFQSFVVGGHGVCKGRCGAGCPWVADPAYTQDCLNHDACAGEEGQQYGVCGDEWNAAADDFLFAPDCT